MKINKKLFQHSVLTWYDKFGRKNLPWQNQNAYLVWISEIMLQQTQVNKVVDYFNAFIEKFPTMSQLAHAQVSDVLQMWSGLGYYNRARNIHKTAQICHQQFNDELPIDLKQLMQLPGIGQTTAGAILSLAHNLPFGILDGNVKRVLSRVYLIKEPKLSLLNKKLWELSNQLIELKRPKNYNQSLMDIGSLLCKRSKPNCDQCPLNKMCQGLKQNVIEHYPQAKVKTKQIKETLHVLLIKNEQSILLQKRPGNGIWPELWFLPLFNSQKDIANYIGNSEVTKFEIKHILSHRILTIKVTSIRLKNHIFPEYKCFEINNIGEIPHPTALVKIIEKITNRK